MKLVLHIGTEKTGTTAIQSALSSQREYLLRNGVCYAKSAGDLNCQGLAAAFTSLGVRDDYVVKSQLTDPERYRDWRQNLLQMMRREISAAKDRCHTFVLSSEHFSSRLIKNADVTDLAKYLGTEFDDVAVVCYLRRQDLMATSRINEGLRAGFPQRWFPSVTEGNALPHLYDYRALLERWSAAFGESAVKPRIFERSKLVAESIVADFSETHLGLPVSPTAAENLNVSLSLTAQIALMMFNEAMGVESRMHVSKHRRELGKYLEQVAPGSDGKPSRSQALSFYENFREGNNYLAQLYFNRDYLFDENFDQYPEIELTQDVELAATLLRDFYASRFTQ
ncbi:MAG: hypothetical protein CME58_11470 [Halieaceae bacterium]|nr:hypothetical protein [Halieaceae bacterium]